MASGIAVNPMVESTFKKLSKRELSVMVLKISSDMTEVSVEKTLEGSETDLENQWKEFVKTVPEADCRYIITDFRWRETPTVVSSKIILILWSPEYAPVKAKMIYAASQEAVTAKVAAARCIQATEIDELQYTTIKSTISK